MVSLRALVIYQRLCYIIIFCDYYSFMTSSSFVDKADSETHKISFNWDQSNKDKLTINALVENAVYQVQLQASHLIDFEQIKEKLKSKEFKLQSMTTQVIKIRAGAVKLEFYNVQKINLDLLKQAIKELTVKVTDQTQKNIILEDQIKKQHNQLDSMTSKITDLAKKYDLTQEQLTEIKRDMAKLKIKHEEQATQANQLSIKTIKHQKELSQIKNQLTEHQNMIKSQQEVISSEWQRIESQNKINQSREQKRMVEELKKEVYSKFLTKDQGVKKNFELTNLIEQKNMERQNSQKTLGFLIQSLEEKVHQIQNNPQKDPSKSSVIHKFSPQQKSKEIRLKDNNCKATNQICSLLNSLLNPFFPLALTQGSVLKKDSSIRFKINKLGQCVGVGLVISSIAAANQYTFKNRIYLLLNQGQPGHGCFALLWNGRSFCHSHKEFNDEVKGFEFGTGDVISVVTNVEELIFTNESKKKVFKLKIKLTDNEWSQARFCAIMRGGQDEVEVIQ